MGTRQFFRPNSGPTPWNWIDFKGPDAGDFLKRLSSTRVPAPGRGTPSFFLNANGKIQSFFWLWHLAENEAENEFVLECEAGQWTQFLLDFIDRYTFSEKIEVHVRDRVEPIWFFEDGPSGEVTIHEDTFHHGSETYGKNWMSSWQNPQTIEGQEISFDEIELLRIQNLGPRLGHEITQECIPIEIGMLNAISQDKGCYPGQEVIEKIISRGAPPRRLALIEGSGPLPTKGSEIQFDGKRAGEVTSIASTQNGFTGLGLLQKSIAKEGQSIYINENEARIIRIAPIHSTHP